MCCERYHKQFYDMFAAKPYMSLCINYVNAWREILA